jgi:threonine dehydratase
MHSGFTEIPDFEAVRAAANRIAGVAARTPLLTSLALEEELGLRPFVKAENLQRTGSFKFRGAYNALSQFDEKQREKGVVACSSGNHAQGVAEAARILGIAATIVMPRDAPATKLERTRRSGAQVVLYERNGEDRIAIAMEISQRTGAAFLHPYEDARVIAGQGTCGLEICEQLDEAGVVPDRVLVCTGGGGLTAGISLAVRQRFPDTVIHPVEPEGYDDTRRSLQAGRIVSNQDPGDSACDALLSPSPGTVSFEINRKLAGEGLVVTDEQAFQAMRVVFEEFRLVVEPGGAVAFAALLANANRWRGQNVVAVLSGGNVDAGLFARVLSGEI